MISLITNGTNITINQTGETLTFSPGIISNNDGKQQTFICGRDRGMNYFLEYLLILALFGKRPLNIKLKGITNDPLDGSVDTFMYTAIPLLKKFGVEGEVKCKLVKRGFRPKGNGEVLLYVPVIKYLRACDL